MPEPTFKIRRYEPRDEGAAYEVCLKTGDSGRDATALYTDPRCLGHIYVGPYLRFEPELAFVLEDALGVCGYALGALDSARFYRRYSEEWLPPLQARYREPEGGSAQWTQDERVYYEFHHPSIYYPSRFHDYPSHAHIDLLPRVQGQGQGKLMMNALLDRMRSLGSVGVHLGLAASNARAEHFYRKLGFVELDRTGEGEDQTLYMAKRLD